MSILDQTLMTDSPDYMFFVHDGVDDTSGTYVNPVLIQSTPEGIVPPIMSLDSLTSDGIVVREFSAVTNAMAPTLNVADDMNKFISDKMLTLLKMIMQNQYDTTGQYELSAYIDAELNNMNNESMIDSVNDMLNQNKHKYDFQEKKNKLITLMTKNNNIREKHAAVRNFSYIMLFITIMYAVFTAVLYMYGKRIESKQAAVDVLESLYYILIIMGIVVIIIIAIVDVYRKFKMKHYEHFTTEADLVSKINKYVTDLPNYANLYLFLEKNLVNEHGTRKRMAESMLNDFDIMNYKNVRMFQLTNYQISRIRHNNKYLTYALLAIAFVGVMGGLNLRTRLMITRKVINPMPISTPVFFWITALITVFMIIVFALQEHQNMSRRRYNWNKMYWLIKNSDGDDGINN